jgi:prepilin-type N-terminal cleavage/methylation domain-containing protein/prepilin-type processing-associated H-X9-DG protein
MAENDRKSRLRRPCAFTLVELLTVIAIIAVLIGFLLPTLRVAHSRALRLSCANNERQLYFAIQAYSYASHDYIPIGYDWYMGSNYIASYASYHVQTSVLLGYLDNLNLLSVPAIGFCPAENDSAFLFNSYYNPWPFVNTTCSFTAYGVRPMTNWEIPISATNTLPKLTLLPPHTAILADTFPLWSALATRHVDGVNVCYSDGSVTYALAAPTLAPLQTIVTGYDYHNFNYSLTVARYNNVFLNSSVTPNTGIWATFDGL